MKKYKKIMTIILLIALIMVLICFIPISASKLIPRFEEQISNDLGVKVHIERLILQLGPSLKVKTPIVHVMYKDGQKFAQLNAVKLYIPWGAVIKNKPVIKSLYAKSLNIRINSDDNYLSEIVKNLQCKNYSDIPAIYLKNYKFSYNDKNYNDVYIISGQEFEAKKNSNFKNFEFNTKGSFSINDLHYINYDLVIKPDLYLNNEHFDIDVLNIIQQIKAMDFNSDIIADLKVYRNQHNSLQASGFINIDNITVADKTKKDPKSFIYLTLWGDKAGILSNIFTSVDKKIYIEGTLNNSQKPIIDLKVKADEINAEDLFHKLKIFTNLSKYLVNLEEIKGKINANFSLKGDLSKIKSNGFMHINDGAIKAKGIQIEQINSNIDFSNNVINISEATGMVKNSPIMIKGAIGKNINLELLMDKVQLKYLCPENWGIEKGIMSLVANITGQADNIVHKENLKIDNLALSKRGNFLNIESIKIDTNKGNTAYISNAIAKTAATEMIKLPSMKLIIDKDKINIPDTNIFLPNSKLVLKSDITDYSSNNIAFNLKIKGFVHSSDIIKLKKYNTKYPLQLSIFGNKDAQNLNGQILLESNDLFDESSVINIVSKFEKDALKIEDISVIASSGKFTENLKLNTKGSKKVIINGVIDNLKKPVYKNIRLFTPQQLSANIFGTIAQLKGDIFINGDVNNPEIVGQALIQNLYNKDTEFMLTNGSADFNKNLVTVNAPYIKIGDSTFGINGILSTDIKEGFKIRSLNIKSKYLNTDTLLAYKDLMQYPYEVQNGKFYSEKLSSGLYDNRMNFTALSCDFSIKDSILKLSNIAAESYNGKLGGQIDINMKTEQFNSNIMGRGISAAPIFNIISDKNEQISGVMDFDSELSGNINSKQSLTGMVKFIVKNGRMPALGKLEHLLYAQNVVADSMLRTSLSVVTKAITLKDTGLFKYLKGDVSIKNGIANINGLQSQGPHMALFIKGQYNTLNDYAKLVVLGRISDEVLSGLGVFGDFSLNKLMVMLTGEENKFNVNYSDLEYLPQLQAKNTKEFRSIINGPADKTSSVLLFNWISYSQKSLRQKDIPMTDIKLPAFINELSY